MKKINDILASLPATIIAGIFLILSFVLSQFKIDTGVDLAWGSIVISGIPLIYLALWRVRFNLGISKISSALLIVIAMFAAIFLGDYFAAGEVAFIMSLGAILEEMTTRRAKKGIKNLIEAIPKTARKVEGIVEHTILVEDVKIGDIIRVLAGEVVSVDGIVVDGDGSVDQSIITGESLPIDKFRGDEVYCGSLTCYGYLDIRVTRVGEDNSLNKLIKLILEADEKKSPIQRIADKVAVWLVPIALLISILAYFLTDEISRAVSVLVVFCPCALVLATPTAIMAAIGQATKHGVIIKSKEALEIMGSVRQIAFDKTGTLTYGRLRVSDIFIDGKLSERRLLQLAASVELKSEHPLAKAILRRAKDDDIALVTTEEFRMEAGKGVKALVDKEVIYCGNLRFIQEKGINISKKLLEAIAKFSEEGKAIIIVSNEQYSIGVIALFDEPRRDAAKVIDRLKAFGIKTILLSGDNEAAARTLATKVGIEKLASNLLPEEKVDKIRELQKAKNPICMVGDGINDAPALKAAQVGIAMGSIGSDIAIEVADIALMSDDITKLIYLKKLSAETILTIKKSITLSMVINIVAIIMSVVGILTPTTAALVHNAGSIFVVLMAALLYDKKIK